MNGSASAHPVIRRTGRFAVNILSEADLDVAGRFAGRDGIKGEDRFEGLACTQAPGGAPILAESLASFDCILEAEHRYGTHSVFIGRVLSARPTRRGLPSSISTAASAPSPRTPRAPRHDDSATTI